MAGFSESSTVQAWLVERLVAGSGFTQVGRGSHPLTVKFGQCKGAYPPPVHLLPPRTCNRSHCIASPVTG
jgi:hypothetical protein